MKRAIFFVLCLIAGQTIISQNLVTNPGFESWETPARPEGWTLAQNCESNTTNIISGVYSCKHSGTLTDRSDLSQTIPITSGKEYRLSYYCRTEVTGTGAGARIWCYWKDSEGVAIDDPVTKSVLQPTGYIKNTVFQLYTLTAVAPAGAVSFNLEFRTYKNSSAWWDDIVFEENVITAVSGSEENMIKIYPNPCVNYLTISNITCLQYIEIQAITGLTIKESRFNNEEEVTISVSDLQDGVYIIRIKTAGKSYYKKFIKKNLN